MESGIAGGQGNSCQEERWLIANIWLPLAGVSRGGAEERSTPSGCGVGKGERRTQSGISRPIFECFVSTSPKEKKQNTREEFPPRETAFSLAHLGISGSSWPIRKESDQVDNGGGGE
ncbi:C-type lectin domain family 2 member D [Platysternon megacephalum]|uniref:C-type lectin domain family 2 member D n=1 Tax=Platysternon megacephalum TaxID=55544 RepID=A0A4D9DP85_9SAUR|nr:C-type lectin domain family 2 member D [Platysternon megacephalum]